MKAQQKILAGVAVFTALALAGMVGIFTFIAAQPVEAQDVSPSAKRVLEPATVAPGGDVVVTVTISNSRLVGNAPGPWGITETLPTGFTYKDTQMSGENQFQVLGGATITYTITAGANLTAGTTHNITGDLRASAVGSERPATYANYDTTTITVAATPVETPTPEDAVSSKDPGANVRIELSKLNAETEIPAGDDFTVNLKGFSLPDSIANTAVLISSTGYTGSPAEVLVGSNGVVTISLYSRWPGGAQADPIQGAYTVTFKQSAGIDNPAAAGDIKITVKDNDATDHEVTHTVERVIKLSKGSGTRGTMTTATLKGFANGTATLNLNGPEPGNKLAEVTIADNVGEHEIDTTNAAFKANQNNELTAVDSSGMEADKTATFIISPKVTLDPAETEVSKVVTVKLSDWVAGDTIATVTIGGAPVMPTSDSVGNDGKAEFKITVPGVSKRGTQTVKVTGTKNAFGSDPAKAVSATASLNVGVLALDVQPSTVVPGQEITITGSGFKAGDVIKQVSVGGKVVNLGDDEATASSSGNIVITIKVPSRTVETTESTEAGIGDGKKTVVVEAVKTVEGDQKDNSGRVAEGSIEIPKAAISLSPGTSRRGTEVTVTGSGFPAGDLVQIKYVGTVVAARATDTSGQFTAEFEVPNSASIGMKHVVEATSVGNYKADSAKADHSTPGAEIELSADEVSSGTQITIDGKNFPAFSSVAVMEIGGVDVRPVPAPSTTIDGDFSSTVLVPGLDLGNQNVKVTVKPVTITTFLEIGTAAVSSVPADVFAGLGERLSRVWYLDAENQDWLFYDPAPEFAEFNDLTEITAGEAYIIIISDGEPVEFQGRTLYSGSNNVALR